MLNYSKVTLLPPKFHCISIILTGQQYKILKKLSSTDIGDFFYTHLLEEKDVLSCLTNNIKKDPLKNGRVFKQLNVRCSDEIMKKIKSYEITLRRNPEEILRCFLLTVTLLI